MTSPSRRRAPFRNRYPHPRRGFVAFLRWLRQFRRTLYVPVPLPRAEPDVAFLKANRAHPTLTWIGQSTFLIQIGGLNLLTDPHLTARASPLPFGEPRRLAPPGLSFEQLPPLDLALVSHNHYDHLDAGTARRLAREHALRFVVPLGLGEWMRRRGADAVELNWWESADVKGARVTAVPVQHFSGRGPFDHNRTLWTGYVVELAGLKIFFAGDTGYSRDFHDVFERFGPMDLALLPIGAYETREFMQAVHVTPEEAVQIHRDLEARLSVAMHWGTFRLTPEPIDEPPARLARALAAAGIPPERFVVLRHGETLMLDALVEESCSSSARRSDSDLFAIASTRA